MNCGHISQPTTEIFEKMKDIPFKYGKPLPTTDEWEKSFEWEVTTTPIFDEEGNDITNEFFVFVRKHFLPRTVVKREIEKVREEMIKNEGCAGVSESNWCCPKHEYTAQNLTDLENNLRL